MFFGFHPESGPLYVMAEGLIYGKFVAQAISAGQALPLKGHSAIGFTQIRICQRPHPSQISASDSLKDQGEEASEDPLLGSVQMMLPLHHWQEFLDQLSDQGGWGETQSQRLHKQMTQMSQTGHFACPHLKKSLSAPMIMGILNVTPDSFSDGGQHHHLDLALVQAEKMCQNGADLIDIGGESTRPGAQEISLDVEKQRVLPVIAQIRQSDNKLLQKAYLSLDTRHSQIMIDGLSAGVNAINDVMALQGPGSLKLLAKRTEPVMLMHMQGNPETMQNKPNYQSVLLDIYDWLEKRLAVCQQAGISLDRIVIDPGIGFGKSVIDNFKLMRHIRLFHGLGAPILLGASRKSFIAHIGAHHGIEWPADQRLAGSLWAVQTGLAQAVQIFRVHDVLETDQLRKIWQAGQTQ